MGPRGGRQGWGRRARPPVSQCWSAPARNGWPPSIALRRGAQGLAGFGTGFLSRFEGSQCPARLLEEITIVDTPGERGAARWAGAGGLRPLADLLPPVAFAGASRRPPQRVQLRSGGRELTRPVACRCRRAERREAEDRAQLQLRRDRPVVRALSRAHAAPPATISPRLYACCFWALDVRARDGRFAARCDLIFLLFDPAKLDISDEFKQVRRLRQPSPAPPPARRQLLGVSPRPAVSAAPLRARTLARTR